MLLYPGNVNEHILKLNDAGLRKDVRFKPVSLHEYVRFWGMVIGARQYSEKGKDLWNATSEGLREPPNFGKYMHEYRFNTIRRLIPEILAQSASDPWAKFRPMVEGFNANRRAVLHHDGDSTFDESMSAYQPQKDKLGGLPNISFIKRKPKPLGTEFKTVCDCETGVMTCMEIQEGKTRMRQTQYAHQFGVQAGCTLRLAESCNKGTCLMGDSWFGSVKACAELAKRGFNFIGVIKMGHALYPKDYLQTVLGPLPAGSRVVMIGNARGTPLTAIGYKYNRKKVLFFIATPAAGSVEDGNPYVQRWMDEHGNILTSRCIARPAVISNYFEVSPRVDNHNQSRQHDLALEELWLTQDPWFRLHTTLHGILATDCWKLAKYHVHPSHPFKNITINNDCAILAHALIYNNLDGIGRVTRSVPSAERHALVPLPEASHGHTQASLGRDPKKNKTKQRRCKWCTVFQDRHDCYTSFYCVECNVPLCVFHNGKKARNCFANHQRATQHDLAMLSSALDRDD